MSWPWVVLAVDMASEKLMILCRKPGSLMSLVWLVFLVSGVSGVGQLGLRVLVRVVRWCKVEW